MLNYFQGMPTHITIWVIRKTLLRLDSICENFMM